jgi:hypothetical protein
MLENSIKHVILLINLMALTQINIMIIKLGITVQTVSSLLPH